MTKNLFRRPKVYPYCFYGVALLIALWGCGGSLILMVQGKVACTLCLWHRGFYGALLMMPILAFKFRGEPLKLLTLCIVGAELFLSIGQLLNWFCADGVCRRVPLPEKLNLIVASLGFIALSLLLLQPFLSNFFKAALLRIERQSK